MKSVGNWMRGGRLLLLLSPFTVIAPLAAQEHLPDPTQPMLAPGQVASVSDKTSEEEVLRLESVLLGKQRAQAIISGEIYQLGQMVGKSKLVQIQPQFVVLAQGGKTQKLLLFPGLEKDMGLVNSVNSVNSSSSPKKTKK